MAHMTLYLGYPHGGNRAIVMRRMGPDNVFLGLYACYGDIVALRVEVPDPAVPLGLRSAWAYCRFCGKWYDMLLNASSHSEPLCDCYQLFLSLSGGDSQ